MRPDGARFITKGDNNGWVDSTRPAQEDMIGQLWFSVPGGGKVLGALRTPRNAALASGLLALLALAGTGSAVRRRRARRGPEDSGGRSFASAAALAHAFWPFLVLAGLACLTLGVVAFSRSSTETARADFRYEQSGSFGYAAAAPRGPVYENRTVETGDPVFLRLVDTLPVRFAYQLEADTPLDVAGTADLSAELSDESGWSRSIPLGLQTRFRGSTLTAEGRIDFRRLWRALRRVQAATGVAQESYDLNLVASVAVHGTVAGQEIKETFAPRVPFRLDPLKLQVSSDERGSGPASLFTSSRTGSLPTARTAPANITLLGHSVSVETARRLSLAGGATWLLAALLTGSILFGMRRDEPARIRAKYGSLLVPLAPGAARPREEAAEVATMDALVRIAKSAGRMVLHTEEGGAHTYVVNDEGPSYRYRTFASEEARAAALAREAEARARTAPAHNGNGNGNGNGSHPEPAQRAGLLAQFLGSSGPR